MLNFARWVVLAVIVPYSAFASQEIPFVGCPADGQAGPLNAPHGNPKIVAIDPSIASQLAYYKAKNGPGVYAPRRWHCRLWYGSSGGTLIVAPEDFGPPFFPMPNMHTPAVSVSHLFGGTSGRFGVAAIAARYFPTMANKFVSTVRAEAAMLDSFDSSMFEQNKYPNDSLHYLNDVTVEFLTPAMRSGMGTEDTYSPTADPIKGVIVLISPDMEWPSVSILRIRLPAVTAQLEHAILHLEEACLQEDTEY
jgi:hypothetical protein